MGTLKVVQVGMGPLGQKMSQFLAERAGIQIVAAVDKDPKKLGKTIAEHCGVADCRVPIKASLAEALQGIKADVAVLTTTSTMTTITPQIEEIVAHKLPVISTCEELSFPWLTTPDLAQRLDAAAKKFGVAVLGTGVNPGFLMDYLPAVLTGVCRKISAVRIARIQDAKSRRLPFQQKIGAGLTLAAFEKKKLDRTLRHVGLTESMHMIAHRLGWKLDRTEDVITPIIAKTKIVTDAMTIEAGQAAGVQQIGRGFVGADEKLTLTFRAAIGEPNPADTVTIEGEPSITSTIPGGVNGDIATCAIIVNGAALMPKLPPGLRTMVDIPAPTWFSRIE